MSLVEHPGRAIGRKIKALRESLPRPENRTTRSTIDYPSQAEFAQMLGADRYRVIDWERNGAIPDRRYRVKLAELAGNGASPDDFTVDPAELEAEVQAEVVALAERVNALERQRDEDRTEIRRLSEALREARREEALEQQEGVETETGRQTA